MKKYQIALLSGLLFLLAACTEEPKDPYKDYRKLSANQLFAQADSELAKGNYKNAITRFEALDALYPFGDQAEQGQLEIIYAYYKDSDIPSAVAAADRYVRLYPRSKNVDYAYYMRGIVGFEMGQSWLQKLAGISPATRDISTLQQSFSSFQTLATHYPRSRYTPDALVRMSYIRNMLADREIIIAKEYMQRSAYIAAANRATYVVQHFQGTPSVREALEIMQQSYEKLGMTKMAADSEMLLRKNFPKKA